MKVLYLINHAGKAGTERYVHTLAEKLKASGVELFFAYNEDGLLVERMKELGAACFKIKLRSRFDFIAAQKLASICRKNGIELIHAQFLRENYIALLARLFYPKVKVIYTNHFILANNLITRLSNRLMTYLQAGVIAVCNPGKEMLIKNGNKADKITVLHNAVDIANWKPETSTVREEFSIPDGTCVMLCASRFAHDKGHSFLVDALAEVKQLTGKPFKCVLAGDGPLLEEIRSKVCKLGLEDSVIFTGFRKDIKNLLFGSDIYINSSEHEALSFLIIEALASGLPVIATDMGGNSDIINSETNCGILVKYNDPGSLSAALVRLMEEKGLRRRLSENALKAVRLRFNLDIAAQETYNLYKKALGKNK